MLGGRFEENNVLGGARNQPTIHQHLWPTIILRKFDKDRHIEA
jgi:hypothetical protein